MHILALASNAVNNDADLLLGKSSQEECFEASSRSLSSFVNEPTLWFELVGKISSP